MNKILSKEHFSEKVVKLVVEAPLIAKARRPGHFVIVICDEKGERIPLTIADADVKRGTITLVVQAIGESTARICAKEAGAPPKSGTTERSYAAAEESASLRCSRFSRR